MFGHFILLARSPAVSRNVFFTLSTRTLAKVFSTTVVRLFVSTHTLLIGDNYDQPGVKRDVSETDVFIKVLVLRCHNIESKVFFIDYKIFLDLK